MSGTRLSLAFVLLCSPSVASAQRQAVPGDTLQLVIGSWRNTVRGVLTGFTPDSVVLGVVGGGERRIAVSGVVATRVLEGREPATGTGAKAGFLAGFLMGGALGLSASPQTHGYFQFGEEIAIVAAGAGGLAGALVGAILGSAGRQERWVFGQLAAADGGSGRPVRAAQLVPTVRMGVESTVLVGLRLRR